MDSKVVGNVVGVPNPRSDWAQNDPTKADFIKNKPLIFGDHLYFDEIDTKYNPSDTIPLIMAYSSRNRDKGWEEYENAPIFCGTIITMGKGDFYYPDDIVETYQIATDGNKIKIRFVHDSGGFAETTWIDVTPTKVSQLENDKGFTTPSDVLHLMRTQHAEHIAADEIDTKYKAGEYIPSLLLYEGAYIDDGKYGSYYENAPFQADGIIITHSCTDSEGYPMAYQFALSWDGKIVHRCCSGEDEFSNMPWSENLIPERLSQLKDDIGFADVKDMYDTLMDAGFDTDKIISAFESAFKAFQIANKNVGMIESVESSIAEFGAVISEKEDAANKITSILQDATDTQYPSAKASYKAIENAKDTAMRYADSITKDFIFGSEIDEKYNADSVIPQILTYYSSGYDNAPFSTSGIIITSMADETGKDEYGSYKVCPQWAISKLGELKYRMVIYGETNYRVPWSENLIPTKVSELENDKEYTTKEEVKEEILATKSEIIAEANEIYANALKGSASGTEIYIDDVSPVPHTVKTNIHSKNLFNINDVFKSTYMDYRVEDNKLIFTKTNTSSNQFSNIFFNLGTCNEFRNKTLTVSITNEFSKVLSAHLVQRIGDTLYTSEPLVKMGIVKANDTTTFTVTVPDNDIEGVLCLRIVAQDTTVNDDEYILSNIQVEYGTQATEYKPYVDIADTTVKVCGANLFDVHSASLVSSNNTCIVEAVEEGHIKVTNRKTGNPQYGRASIPLPISSPKTVYVKFSARVSDTELSNPVINIGYRNSASSGTSNKTESTGITTEWKEYAVSVSVTSDAINQFDELMLLVYTKQGSASMNNVGVYVEVKDIMISTSDSEYIPYESSTHNVVNGVCEVDSIYPSMSISTDVGGVVIKADYNRDINKAFAELQAMILGG